jgi:hypothetical protein
VKVGSCVSGDSAQAVDQGELTLVAFVVVIQQYVNRLLWAGAASQKHQARGAVSGIPEPLRRDNTDLGLAVRHEAPNAGELGLNGYAEVAIGRIKAEDRVSHRPPYQECFYDGPGHRR